VSDERPDSLAAQMGAWVPPWERNRDDLDRDFQADAEDLDSQPGDPADDGDDPVADDEPEADTVDAPGRPEADTVDAPGRPETDPFDEGAAIGYLAGYHDTAEYFGQAGGGDVAEVTAEPAPEPQVTPTVPVQATGPRDAAPGDDRTEKMLDDAELAAALEAILLVVDEPTNELKLAEVLEQPVERVARSLDDLSARYTAAGHGFDLRRAAGGWRLYTRPEYAAYVERFVLDGQSVRLTQAALETLAVVAYKQPVTRSRISAIRGVNCDGVMRTLVTRGLIEECGTEPETGAYLYRTTALFLEKLGLNSVDQLPPLAPFLPDDVEEVLDASG
jgi:segregation and condensation protein B